MPSQTAPAEGKPSYVYSILKTHGQSCRDTKSNCAERGKAKLHIIDFKTTRLEFQKSKRTTRLRGCMACESSKLRFARRKLVEVIQWCAIETRR